MSEGTQDEHYLIATRRAKLAAWRETERAYPNDFRPDTTTAALHGRYPDAEDANPADGESVALAGRLMAKRIMGQASFAQMQDGDGRIQLFLQRESLGDDHYLRFKELDIGDIVGVQGSMMRTRAGELTVRVATLRLLTKSLRPLPEKWHGLADTEARYRQRYLDLIMHPQARAVFVLRSALVAALRSWFQARGFMEVETPMLQAMPGGAAARAFVTHYHALDHEFYLRIAPELFLKRLVIGGFERVFELNRNFRNEGLSTRHNPEFTMLEFYQAHADYRDLMGLIESLLRDLAQQLLGGTVVSYQGQRLDFSAGFERLPLAGAVRRYNPEIDAATLHDRDVLATHAGRLGISVAPGWGPGKLLTEIFEATAEHRLQQPTFVTDYPAEVSPLARRREDDPSLTERFELFVAGCEIANGFSELNDPEDQAERLRAQAQARAAGDGEAMVYDGEYVEALEYGLPPTAGAGIGIDRLAMLFTDRAAIRDVLLFPQLRPRG